MLKNIKTAGELQESIFMTGIISDLNHYLDSCSVSINGTLYTNVPIFYHCNPNAVETSTGAITGGSWGFANNDEVVVLSQGVNKFVIGHKAGARPCVPAIVIFSTDSGAEAVAWDLVNDEVIVAKSSLASVITDLTSMGLTAQDECVVTDARPICYNLLDEPAGFRGYDDLPVTIPLGAVATINETPFLIGTTWYPRMYNDPDYSSFCDPGYYRGNLQPYFTNPVAEQDQDPRPGMWLTSLDGFVESWDDDWGVCPVPDEQISLYNIEQQFINFRSIFDNKCSDGSVDAGTLSTELIPTGLNTKTSLMYDALADGDFFEIADIDINIWLDTPGYTQGGYDIRVADTAITESMVPPFTMAYQHVAMVDFSSGLATVNQSNLLFEWVGIYPNIYEFESNNRAWNSITKARYIQEFKLYLRHPYLQKNKDAVLFNGVNAKRVAAGVLSLEYNFILQRAAQTFSNDMATRLSISPLHIGSDLSTPVQRAEDAGYLFNILSDRAYAIGENVISGPFGLDYGIERAIDNTFIDVPTQYASPITNITRDIATAGWQETHDKDGNLINAGGDGWEQSEEHRANMLNPILLETSMASAQGNDTYTYITQLFGSVGASAAFTDTTEYRWPGFAPVDGTNLLNYVTDNFLFDKANGDERRIPKIYLYSIPQ